MLRVRTLEVISVLDFFFFFFTWMLPRHRWREREGWGGVPVRWIWGVANYEMFLHERERPLPVRRIHTKWLLSVLSRNCHILYWIMLSRSLETVFLPRAPKSLWFWQAPEDVCLFVLYITMLIIGVQTSQTRFVCVFRVVDGRHHLVLWWCEVHNSSVQCFHRSKIPTLPGSQSSRMYLTAPLIYTCIQPVHHNNNNNYSTYMAP